MSLYDKASLVQIPSGYKSGTLYSVLPANGDGDFTHTRASSATRVNKDGLIESVASGVPRLDYPLIDGVVQDCPALLLEPSRTNIATYSEDFSNGVYGKTNGTVTTNSAIAPDGTLTADTWTATGTNGQIQGVVTVSSGVQYTMSIYLKRKTGTGQVALRGVSNTSTNITITDEWQRYSVTLTSSDVNGRYGVLLSTSGDEVYVWGAQLEAGSYPTSYIPTSGSTVTRSADVCNGAGTSAEFNDNEGVLFGEIQALADDSTVRRIALSNSANNSLARFDYSNSSNRMLALVYDGSVKLNVYSDSYDIQTPNKFAIKYKSGDNSFFINGFKVDGNTNSISMSGLSELDFDDGAGLDDFYGKTKQLMTFKTALTDSELETLTSWDSFSEMAKGQLYIIE